MRAQLLVSLVLLGSAAVAAGSAPETVKRTRYPALSPDGKTIAFSYQGDLWSVPAEGGRATRLTSHLARDIQPVFSPDGKSILFGSNRHGNYDLFMMPAEGGAPRRLTFHSGGEYPSSFSPDGRWVLFYGTTYGSSDLYRMPVDGGEPVRLTWDRFEREYFGNVSPDGQWVVYNHGATPGAWRRRGYEGSNSADVWLARFTAPVSEPKRITTNPANDFHPTFTRDGKRVLYVSDRKGQVNLWSMDLDGGAQKQLTFHESDGVRVPSYAPKADRVAYECDSEIRLLDLKSGKSAPVPIQVAADERRNLEAEQTATSDPSEYSVSPDGKKVALIVRGDLFVMPSSGGLARRLVGRASRESHVSWLADSKTVLFVTDEKGNKDLRSIDITGANEKALAESDQDETNAAVSPDGKLIAYHRGDQAIVVIPAEGGAPVATVLSGFPDVSRDYTPNFGWSPDNKWLVFKRGTGTEAPDAVYVAAVADGQPRRVSRYFRALSTPKFAGDGKTIYFTGVAVDSANLYAVDLDEDEKPVFEEDALERLDQPAQRREPGGGADVAIDFNTVLDRMRRVTSRGDVTDAVLTSSGAFFVDTRAGIVMVPRRATDSAGSVVVENAGSLELTKDGDRLYFLSGGKLNSLGLAMRDRKTVEFRAVVNRDLVAENRQVFDEAWWMMQRYFYDEKLHGVDWKATKAKYEAMLPYVPYKDDFYEMMAEMIQELRGSHLGVTGAADYSPEVASETAYLGVEPDPAVLDAEGKFKIAHVVKGSPAASKWSKLNAGEYLLAVDGQPLGKDATFHRLLDRKVGKKVVLTVNSLPTMDGARQVAIKPVSQDAGDNLEYEEWVDERKRMVEKLSNGRLAYLHIRGMNVPSEMRFKEEFIGEANGREALLVDVRYNGGGNVAHRLLDILRKRPYVTFRPRALDKEILSDWLGDYLWGKPAALLINQDSASNSEMMAEGFKALGIGPTIGLPTAGAVIATGTWRFLDGGSIRTPAIGVYTASGENMELRGRQPDHPVPYDPIAIRQGRDPQLEKAVEVLLSQAKKPAVAGAGK